MITYTVTATEECWIDSDGRCQAKQTRGEAETISAAKRKARAEARNYQNKAYIIYEDTETGETWAERNWYGIEGEWREERN